MSLTRVLEPEAMDSEEEASDYDAMDHSAVNVRFCDDLLSLSPGLDPTLDIGTGTARIPIELCRRAPRARVVAIDLAEHMLAVGEKNVGRAGLSGLVALLHADAKSLPYRDATFASVISNSIVHHIPDPAPVLGEALRVLAPGGVLFVRDLRRPETDEEVRALVATYAAGESERQRALFDASLRAAFTLDEVRAIARAHGVPEGAVTATSDRHWTLAWRADKKPA